MHKSSHSPLPSVFKYSNAPFSLSKISFIVGGSVLMDFGSDVGLLSPPSNTTAAAFASSSDPETRQKWYGSGFFKQEISNTSSLFSDGQPQVLSFSSPDLHPVALPYYHQTVSPYARNTGYSSGGLNAANMHGIVCTRVKGPFTPSQWMELEHQALIYKYITANFPVPSNLLNPIRKALESAGISSFPGAHLRPNTLGWSAFHLGFSNTDPEPGRCRRTDGKKWRCSRDAVADQKYCERHVYRGRRRSRKPVEGQTAHSVSGTTSTTTKFLPKSSSTSAASVVLASGTSNSLGLSHHQLKSLQHGAPNPSASPHLNRSYMNKANVGEKIQEQQNPYNEPSRMEFGLVCSDSLLNPFHKSSSLINFRSYGSTDDRQNKSQHSLLQFMDDWPKNQSERTAMLWPDIDMQSDRTQLSISIPMAASDFMSSSSSPTNEKLALSPLRLSHELDSTQMGLGMNATITETNQRQANWIPISWENTMGGPLGEVLHSTNNSAGDCKDTSALNLMTEGWNSSTRLASSPTGVLQKTTLRSLSNSSAGSSPRTENNLLGTNFISASLPAV